MLAIDGRARSQAGLELRGLAQDPCLAGGREPANVSGVDPVPGAMPAGHVGTDLPGIGSFDHDSIGRGEDPSAVDSGAAVDIDRFGRLLHDRKEQRHVIVEVRGAQNLEWAEAGHLKVGEGLREVRGCRGVLERALVVELQADDGADAVIQEPLRVRGVWARSTPQCPGRDDAEVADGGVEVVSAGASESVGRNVDAAEQSTQECERERPRGRHYDSLLWRHSVLATLRLPPIASQFGRLLRNWALAYHLGGTSAWADQFRRRS